jgi:uncharacterized protein YbjT (DUF2867 family)
MKLTIFGATGRIGGHLLTWAVDAGHDVHVLARSPQALRPRDGLTVTGADVAHFIGAALTSASYIRESPALAY